jgi:hypothetical protein
MPTFFLLFSGPPGSRESGRSSFSVDLARGLSTLLCMCELSNRACFAAPGARTQVRAKVNWLSGLLALALLLGLCPVRADDADDQYLQIYGLIQQADDLGKNGKRDPAKAKYLEAYNGLRDLKKNHPDWNVSLVAARLKYVGQQITVLSEEPRAVVTSGTNASEAKTETKPAAPISSGPLKLLGAGAEPRKALRLHPAAGDKQKLVLNTKVALDMKMSDGQPSPIKLPSTSATVDIPVEITVKEVSSKGDISYEVALGDTSAAEEPAGGAAPAAKAPKSSLSGIKGLSATGTISSHGFSKGLDFKAPPGADPQTRMLLDLLKDVFIQFVTPLPEETVGHGAKWEVKAPVQSHSIKIDQTANYELVSVEGETYKTKSTSSQKAGPNQKIDNPIMPGMKVDLTKWTAKGTNEFGLDATKLMPSSGTMELHSEMGMGLGVPGQGINMKMDVSLHIETK